MDRSNRGSRQEAVGSRKKRTTADCPLPTARSRGDTSLLLIFLTLTVVLLGAMALAILAVSNLRGVGDVGESSRAFYAVDQGIERGLHDYYWDVGVPCTSVSDQPVAGQSGVVYDLFISGNPPNPLPGGSCPSVQEVMDGLRALCIEVVGKARGGAVQRRVTNDSYDAGKLTNPCER